MRRDEAPCRCCACPGCGIISASSVRSPSTANCCPTRWTGTINGARVVTFLRHILRHVAGKVLVIWDGASIHRCREVKHFLAMGAARRLKLLPVPGYAPELNPVEGLWRWLKRVALGNVCCATLDELGDELRLAFARLRQRKDVLAACLRRPGYIH